MIGDGLSMLSLDDEDQEESNYNHYELAVASSVGSHVAEKKEPIGKLSKRPYALEEDDGNRPCRRYTRVRAA